MRAAMRMHTAFVLFIPLVVAAGCGSADSASVESAVKRPTCDAYNELDCEADGPRGQILCSCILKAQYDCDPLTDKTDVCFGGQQPQKCVAGLWQNDGPICPNHTVCSAGGCVAPPPPAAASLTVWNGQGSYELSYYDTRDPAVINKNGGSANQWRFRFSYGTPATASAVQYQLTQFPPTGSDLTPPGLVDSGSLGSVAPGDTATLTLDFTRYGFTRDPMDLWLRVIALDPYQNAIAVSNTIHVRYQTVISPTLNIGPQHPNVQLRAYRPVQPPDENYQYWFHVTQSSPLLTALGWQYDKDYYLPPQSPSWFDDITNAIGQALSWLEDAWNWIAHTYNSIKSGIIDATAAALQCGDPCKSLLGAALDAGLAACGLPPSLPDVDELVSEGEDAIAEQITDLVPLPGLPPDAAKTLIVNAAQQMTQAKKNGGNAASFLAPAPSKQYHSAVVFLTLTNPSTQWTVPSGTVSLFDFGTLFDTVTVRYSAIPPGGSTTVRLVLTPITPYSAFQDAYSSCWGNAPANIAGTPAVLGYCLDLRHSAFVNWSNQYTTGPQTFSVSTIVEGSDGTGGQRMDHGTITVDLGANTAKAAGL